MKQDTFGLKIKGFLDSGLTDTDVPVARLAAARERALAAWAEPVGQTEAVAQTAWELAAATTGGAGSGGAQPGQRGRAPLDDQRTQLIRFLLPAAILIAAALGWHQWQQANAVDPVVQGVGRIDAELLNSDLPVDALIDPDFRAYLHKVSDHAPNAPEQKSQ